MAENIERKTLARAPGLKLPALKTLEAFESPAFRLLWLNTLSFSLVQGIQRFAFVWLVIDALGKGPAWSGIMTFAVGIPGMFLMLPAGVLSDRVNRRRLMMWTQVLALMVMALATALISADLMTPALALAMAIASGSAATLGTPVRMAVLPSLVEREKLMNAIVMSTVGQNIMMIGGPILGGAAIGLWGIEAGFGLQAAAYALGVLTLVPLRIPDLRRTEAPRRPMAELAEGFEFVTARPEMRALVVTLVVSGLFMLGPVFALVPPIARDDMGKDAFAVSMLFGIMAVGMLATSLVLASLGNFRNKGAIFLVNLAIGGVDIALMGVVGSYGLLALLMFVWGMGGGIFINLNRTLIQYHTPDALMGRVMAIQSLGMAGFSPLGGLLAGAAAGPMGAGAFLVLSGAILTAVAAAIYATQPQLRAMT